MVFSYLFEITIRYISINFKKEKREKIKFFNSLHKAYKTSFIFNPENQVLCASRLLCFYS